MGRLLDENDVIDALERVASFFPYRIPGKGETYDKYNEAWNDAIGRAEMEIERLPSAQPELIRCKDCLIHGICRFEQGLGLDGYCSQAERREE